MVDKGCPYHEKAVVGRKAWKFNSYDVMQWILERERAELFNDGSAEDGSDLSHKEAKRREAVARAGMAELELERERGTLASLDEMEAQLSDQFAACRAKVMGMPSKAAPYVAMSSDINECREIMEGYVREALDELTGYRPGGRTDVALGADEEDDPGEDQEGDAAYAAASEDEDLRVGGQAPSPLS